MALILFLGQIFMFVCLITSCDESKIQRKKVFVSKGDNVTEAGSPFVIFIAFVNECGSAFKFKGETPDYIKIHPKIISKPDSAKITGHRLNYTKSGNFSVSFDFTKSGFYRMGVKIQVFDYSLDTAYNTFVTPGRADYKRIFVTKKVFLMEEGSVIRLKVSNCSQNLHNVFNVTMLDSHGNRVASKECNRLEIDTKWKSFENVTISPRKDSNANFVCCVSVCSSSSGLKTLKLWFHTKIGRKSIVDLKINFLPLKMYFYKSFAELKRNRNEYIEFDVRLRDKFGNPAENDMHMTFNVTEQCEDVIYSRSSVVQRLTVYREGPGRVVRFYSDFADRRCINHFIALRIRREDKMTAAFTKWRLSSFVVDRVNDHTMETLNFVGIPLYDSVKYTKIHFELDVGETKSGKGTVIKSTFD
ncbi:hypothetical protein MHBO_000525 [Bonamia ostreae]|uniref:Uncharacterized protein n=1 Tax=Bonamia ostreae TaxID=126728 RepID=A0ABV2AFW3_9EUKA